MYSTFVFKLARSFFFPSAPRRDPYQTKNSKTRTTGVSTLNKQDGLKTDSVLIIEDREERIFFWQLV